MSDEQRSSRIRAHGLVVASQRLGTHLDLSHLQLQGVLPPVPLVRILCIDDNPGLTGVTSLPPNLISLQATHCGLEQLPRLPETLERLNIDSNNGLRTLPRLPPSVTGVSATECGLERLEPFPDGSLLRILDVGENPLGELPTMPEHLHYLHAYGCGLTAVPVFAGSNLHTACLSGNQIEDISQPLSNSTRYLDLRRNPVSLDTTLPDWMLRLSQDAVVTISLGHLPNAAMLFDEMRLRQNSEGWTGPSIEIDMIDSNNPTQAGLARLEDAVAPWLGQAPEAQVQGQAWREFANEDGAQAFADFLNRLATTTNNVEPATREPFGQGVCRLLTDMASSPQLRADCFAICIDANETCEDRVTLSYQSMAVPRLAQAVRRGDFDTNPALPGFIDQTRSLYRRDLLTDIANRKAATMPMVDVIEVHLALQVRLNQALDLHLDAEQMAYFRLSGLSDADFLAAEREVKQSENQGFANHLINHSGPWAQLMQRRAPELYEQMIEAKHTAIEPQRLAPAIRAHLAGLELQNDADAERETGRAVTDQLTFHAQQAFVHQFLREHDNHPERLLGPVWPA